MFKTSCISLSKILGPFLREKPSQFDLNTMLLVRPQGRDKTNEFQGTLNSFFELEIHDNNVTIFVPRKRILCQGYPSHAPNGLVSLTKTLFLALWTDRRLLKNEFDAGCTVVVITTTF